ncbi:MAG: ABC transporter substrate-binding protein [Microbacteriaceae bacterium]
MKKRIIAGTLSLVLGLALTGCAASSSTSGGTGGEDTGTAVLKAGLLPNAETAAIRLGKDKGFFTDKGIDLQITDTTSGAASLTALVAGQFDVVFANTVSVMQGNDKGLPLVMIAAASTSTGVQGKDFSALMVGSKANFQTPKDLEGKTIASNTVKNIGELTARISVEKAGGSTADLKFVELPFDNMEQALESGQIDAAWMVEPFHTTALQHGLRDLTSNYVDTAPGLTAAAFVTTKKVIDEKPELIKKFVSAITESGNYANGHPNEVRGIIPKFTKLTPEIANQFVIPLYNPEVNVASLEAMLPEMVKESMISKDFDVNKVIYK